MRLAWIPGGLYIAKSFAVLAEILAILWIYAICTRSTKEMKIYKMALVKMACLDLCFSISLVWLFAPDANFPEVVGTAHGLLTLAGKNGAKIGLVCVCLTAIYMLFAVNDCCHIRTAALYQRMDLLKFTNWKLYGPYVVLYIFTASLVFIAVVGQGVTAQEAKVYLQRINNKKILDTLDFDTEIIFCLEMDNPGKCYIFMGIVLGGLIATQSVNAGFTYFAHKKSHELREHLSPATLKMQHALTRMMVAQIAYPFCSVTLVLQIFFFGSLFQYSYVESDGLYLFGVISFLSYPIVNSLSSLLFIKPYRQLLLDLLFAIPLVRRLKKSNIISITVNPRSFTNSAITH